MTALWEALRDDWLITLRCERHREGLKSRPPCTVVPQILHVPSLVAMFGPDLPTEQLAAHLRCPRCGSRQISIGVAHQVGAKRVPRKMKPVTSDSLGRLASRWIVFTCPQCGRRGEYKRESLVEEFGPDINLPSLLLTFAAARNCNLARAHLKSPNITRPIECKIHFDVDPES